MLSRISRKDLTIPRVHQEDKATSRSRHFRVGNFCRAELVANLLYQSLRTNAARDVWKVAATIRFYHPVDFGMLFKTEIHGECLQISCHPTIDGKQDTILDGKTSCSGQKFDIVLHGVERKLWPTTRMGADFAHGKQS